jgi:hypothetical protein
MYNNLSCFVRSNFQAKGLGLLVDQTTVELLGIAWKVTICQSCTTVKQGCVCQRIAGETSHLIFPLDIPIYLAGHWLGVKKHDHAPHLLFYNWFSLMECCVHDSICGRN